MSALFLRRLAQGGGLSLVKLVTGLVKVKVLAVVLGVEGVGALSLGLQFQATAVGLVSMSLAVGVINLGRPRWVAGDAAAAGEVLGSALSLVGANALVLLVGVALYEAVSGGAQALPSLWPLALAAVVVSFANVMWEGLSFLVDRFDLYVRTNIAAAVGDALLFGLGAWWFGLRGAVAASLLASTVLFLAYTLFTRRAPATRAILARLSVSRRQVRPLLSYSALMLGTTAMGLVCVFSARAWLTAVAGEAANGHLQVVTALAAYLLPFVMTGVWGHLHPAAAASGDTEPARNELRRTLVASMRLGCAGCACVVMAAPVLVHLVYTPAFMPALGYIPVYFAGELGYMFLSVLGAYLLAVGHKRVYFIGYAAYHLALLGVALASAAAFGVWGYVAAHVGSALGLGALAAGHAWRRGLLDAPTLRNVGAGVGGALLCCLTDAVVLNLPDLGLALRASLLVGPVVVVVLMVPLLRPALQRLGRGSAAP